MGMMVHECSISIAPILSQMQMDEKSLRLFFHVPKKLKLEHCPVKSDFTLSYSRMCDAPILQLDLELDLLFLLLSLFPVLL
jgi:hypothetical protein